MKNRFKLITGKETSRHLLIPYSLNIRGGRAGLSCPKLGGAIPEILLFIFQIFFCPHLFAQPEGIALRRLTTDDGLPHNNITSIEQDTQGFMWFGTHDGLTRYDGKRCTVFRPHEGDTTSLPSNVITGLSLDPLGRLWVATTRGLCHWDYADRHFHRFPIRLPGHNKAEPVTLSRFAFDQQGVGWAVSDTFLIRFNARSFQMDFIPIPTGLGGLAGVFMDSKGRIWVTIGGNLIQYFPESGRFEFKMGRLSSDPRKSYIVCYVAEDGQGRVWCSTWGMGFYILNEKSGEFEDYPDSTAIATVFLFDRDPVMGPIIWTGGGLYGLEWRTLANGGTIPFPPRPREPFSHNNAMTSGFYKDRTTGIVWIGTENGIEKYDPNDLKFTRIVFPESIMTQAHQFGSVSGIVQDMQNPHRYFISVWAQGFYEWNRKTGSFEYVKGVASNEIFEIIRAKNGKVWLAERFGLEEFDPVTGRFRTFKPDFPTPGINHKVLQILEGRDGRIWFGSNHEGVYWLDPVSGKCTKVALDGKKHYIRALGEDRKGRILVGDMDGYYRYDPATDSYEHFLQKDTSYHPCNDFAFDRNSKLWVGTDDGLFLMSDDGRIEFALTTRNGLQNNRIHNIEIDPEDRFWLATPSGLHRYYPPTGVMNVYRRPDGLFENDISVGFQMLPRGELFIGFSDAFNLANTAHLPMNPHPPRVALTEVFILNKPVPWRMGEPVVLRPGENVVTFDFAALNFTQPEKTVLVYKLEGFNHDWAETKQNHITYTNLDGGDYTLLVRARNGDGIWSQETVHVRLRVIPPFTKTIWFRLILLGLIGGLIAGIAWYRQQQRLQLEAIRRRIARDLHDDMGSTVSSIRFFSEVAQGQLLEEQTNTKDLLARISQSAATLSESIQDIVWAINARHDNLDDLVARMREFGLKISEARNIRFHADIPAQFPHYHLRPDTRRNIYLIFKEAINNAAKYSGCTDIHVLMQLNGRKLFSEIKDNGKGFDAAEVQYGNGIANMRQRAEEIKGKLEIRTAPGEGVHIVLEVGV